MAALRLCAARRKAFGRRGANLIAVLPASHARAATASQFFEIPRERREREAEERAAAYAAQEAQKKAQANAAREEAQQQAAADASARAVAQAEAMGICGKESTPFLLAKVKELTGGDSLESNIQLVFNNAVLAAKTAVAMAR